MTVVLRINVPECSARPSGWEVAAVILLCRTIGDSAAVLKCRFYGFLDLVRPTDQE